MWFMNVLILLHLCYTCSSTDRDVYFKSRNFFNVLHWKRPKNLPPEEKVFYNVEYKSYLEEPYRIKSGCQNITDLICDLTTDTPSIHDVHYIARVNASGRVYGKSFRLNPIADTILGPANLTTCKPKCTPVSLHINVTLPLGPGGISVADWIYRSKNLQLPIEMEYVLHITFPEVAVQHYKSTSGSFNINFTRKSQQYCGHVYYLPSTETGRPASEPAPFCVTLPADPMATLPWVVLGAVLLAALAIAPCVSCWIYVKGGTKSTPSSLKPFASSVEGPHMDKPTTSKVFVCSQMDAKIGPVGYTRAQGGFSPQDGSGQPGKDNSGLTVDTSDPGQEEQDDSSQSSVTYVTVDVRAPGEESTSLINEKRSGLPAVYANHNMWTTTNPKTTLPCVHEEEPCGLQLRTSRDENGQLTLPLFDFQFQDNRDETPVVHLSDLFDHDSEEVEPLQRLSSLDSGCDSSEVTPTHDESSAHYFQNVAPGSLQGCSQAPPHGYKQNWMPDGTCKAEPEKDTIKYMSRTDA